MSIYIGNPSHVLNTLNAHTLKPPSHDTTRLAAHLLAFIGNWKSGSGESLGCATKCEGLHLNQYQHMVASCEGALKYVFCPCSLSWLSPVTLPWIDPSSLTQYRLGWLSFFHVSDSISYPYFKVRDSLVPGSLPQLGGRGVGGCLQNNTFAEEMNIQTAQNT